MREKQNQQIMKSGVVAKSNGENEKAKWRNKENGEKAIESENNGNNGSEGVKIMAASKERNHGEKREWRNNISIEIMAGENENSNENEKLKMAKASEIMALMAEILWRRSSWRKRRNGERNGESLKWLSEAWRKLAGGGAAMRA